MKLAIKTFLVFCMGVAVCQARGIPSFIQRCKPDYPQVSECIRQQVNAASPQAAKGIPEMKIPPIDPLQIPKVDVDTGSGFRAIFTDVSVRNVQSYDLKKLDFDVDHNRIDLVIAIPTVYISVVANFAGKLGILELNSIGPGQLNVSNIVIDVHINTEMQTRKGKKHVKFLEADTKIDHDDPLVYFEDLFKGNEALTAETNRILNENIGEFIVELKPLIHKVIFTFIYSIVGSVFDNFSVDELFV